MTIRDTQDPQRALLEALRYAEGRAKAAKEESIAGWIAAAIAKLKRAMP